MTFAAVTVLRSTGAEMARLTAELSATPVAALAGVTPVTTGPAPWAGPVAVVISTWSSLVLTPPAASMVSLPSVTAMLALLV